MSTEPEHVTAASWRLSIWEYAVEVILALLTCCFLLIFISGESLASHLCGLRSDLMGITGGALAAAIAVWAIFIDILRGEFGAWLRRKGEASAYSTALSFPVFVYLICLLVLLLADCPMRARVSELASFLLLYGLINFVTMVRNINGLVRLWQAWQNREKEQ